MQIYKISHLVKSEDLNHHGTLFAGRSAEWLVEAGFVAAAATHGKTQEIVCINVHGFTFKKPVEKGDILTIESSIVRVGTTSLMAHIQAKCEIEGGPRNVEGFVSFVCVDPKTKETIKHGLVLDEPANKEEEDFRRRADAITF